MFCRTLLMMFTLLGSIGHAQQSADGQGVGPITFIEVFPGETVLVERSGLPITDETARAFDEEFIQAGSYFGAFAIGKDGAYGYVTGANSLPAARDIAIAECQQYTNACLLYAELQPMNYDGESEGVTTMSLEASEQYLALGDRPRFRAMAISEDGAYATSWGYGDQQTAETIALDDCVSYRLDTPLIRDMPCRLVPFK